MIDYVSIILLLVVIALELELRNKRTSKSSGDTYIEPNNTFTQRTDSEPAVLIKETEIREDNQKGSFR